MKRILLLLLLLVGIAGTACADSVTPVDTTKAAKIAKKAQKLMKKGKTSEAINLYEEAGRAGLISAQRFLAIYYNDRNMVNNKFYWIEKMAYAGNAEAQRLMGAAYLNGPDYEGQTMFAVDYARAAEWLKKAADQGDVISQNKLGSMYLNGLGVEQSDFYAFRYFSMAAERGDALSMRVIGLMYRDGRYLSKNPRLSFQYLKKAANLGDQESWFYLGLAYHEGIGTDIDFDQAVYWYTKAIEADEPQLVSMAKNNLAVLKEGKAQGGSTNETVRMYRQGAELGQDVSQSNLANCYFNGQGVPQDYEQAIYWYTKAAEQGNAPAQTQLGIMYRVGIGTQPNADAAKLWLTKAAEQNDTTAMCEIAILYDQQGDPTSTFGWVKKAADLDCLTAIASLPYYYNNGIGTNIDRDLAFKYAMQAADRLHPQGFRHLSDCYYFGWGTPKDIKRAITCAIKGYVPHEEDHQQYEERIGLMFMEAESYKGALEWFEKAATPLANYNIGWIYGSGALGSADAKKARQYLEKAARQTEDKEVREHARRVLETL